MAPREIGGASRRRSDEKKTLLFFLIYFFFAWGLTWTYYTTHLVQQEAWPAWHEQLLAGEHGGANQFRVLSFWIPELIHRAIGGSVINAYLLVRFGSTFLTLCLFHLFLLKWFAHERAMLGVTLFSAVMPFTYLPFLQEADVLLMSLFLLGLVCIRERWFVPLLFVVAAGTIVKETMLFLLPMYPIFELVRGRKISILLNSLVLFSVWVGMFLVSRSAFSSNGQDVPLWQLPHNIQSLGTLLQNPAFTNVAVLPVALFGAFWILTFMRNREKPEFFRAVSWYVAVYLVGMYIIGWPEEARLLLPLGFVIIPSGLMTLFGAGENHG